MARTRTELYMAQYALAVSASSSENFIGFLKLASDSPIQTPIQTLNFREHLIAFANVNKAAGKHTNVGHHPLVLRNCSALF